MRIVFTFLLLILNSALGFCQEAEFSLKTSVHKFPRTKEGVVLEHIFEFTNTGNSPLLIQDYSVACHCTKVFFSKDPVLPGEKGSIKVVFDTEGKYYLQDRFIYLQMNTKRKTEKLRFKVFVIPRDESR